jgi:hypothetical protein
MSWPRTSRVFEEILPPIKYYVLAARLSRLATDDEAEVDALALKNAVVAYAALPVATLQEFSKAEILRG